MKHAATGMCGSCTLQVMGSCFCLCCCHNCDDHVKLYCAVQMYMNLIYSTSNYTDCHQCFTSIIITIFSAGNNFFYSQDMSFLILLLVGHFTNWTGHNLLTDNTLKKITQVVLGSVSVIVSDHYTKLAGHFQNLVGDRLLFPALILF